MNLSRLAVFVKRLDIADSLVTGKGDGRISADDAAEFFEKLATSHIYTDLEKDTIAYIRENYHWTEPDDKALRFAVRVWAATCSANK